MFYAATPDSVLTDDGMFGLVWERARHSHRILLALEEIADNYEKVFEGRTTRARERLAELGLWPKTVDEVRRALILGDEDRPKATEDESETRFSLLELD